MCGGGSVLKDCGGLIDEFSPGTSTRGASRTDGLVATRETDTGDPALRIGLPVHQ